MGSETNNPPESIWVTWPKSPDEVYREQYRKWYCIPDGVHQGTWSNEKPEEDGVEYRRADPADDPRVLRRALELLFDQLYDGFCRANAMDRSVNLAIDQARRELESEARDGE